MDVGADVAHQLSGPERQIRRLHQRDAHLLGQEGVLEPGGVFPAGGQQRDRRIVTGVRRRGRAQRVQQHLRGAVGVVDRDGRLQLGQVLAQQSVVDDRVRGARRHPQVVFEHQPVTRAGRTRGRCR